MLPELRGQGLGASLAALSLHPEHGIPAADPGIKEVWTTCHADNLASRTAFIKGGYSEVLTYKDSARDRNTTVLRAIVGQAQGAAAAGSPRKKRRKKKSIYTEEMDEKGGKLYKKIGAPVGATIAQYRKLFEGDGPGGRALSDPEIYGHGPVFLEVSKRC